MVQAGSDGSERNQVTRIQAFVQKDDDLVIGQPILFGRDKKYPLNLPCGDFRSNLINANGEFMPNAY